MRHLAGFFVVVLFVISCKNEPQKLPILGEREVETKTINGKTVEDTIYKTIPNFSFINQNKDSVTEKNIEGKIYITDFFFTTCPTICPVMSKQMLKIYKKIEGQTDVMILSHSIDPTHDTPEVLKQYATDLGVMTTQWQFLTGDREKIYEIGQKHYLVTAGQDPTAPGGYIHSGAFVLIDKHRRIRGLYDGTKEETTDKLLADLVLLRAEK